MTWIFQNARDSFEKYRDGWDAINAACGNHVLLDGVFVGSLVRHFASETTLLGISEDRRNPGMVLLDKVRPGFWQTFQPSQGPLGLVVFSNARDVECQVAKLIRCLPGYPLGLSVLQQDPDFTMFGKLKYSRTAENADYSATSRLSVCGNFEEYWKATGRYFVDDLRRQSRRLDEQSIRMEFVAERDPGKVAECIRDYARLEATGWKGKEGTAVTAENRQGLFYRDVMENFFGRGEGVIYRLLFNEKVVASDLCLERAGMTVVLKIAYDESFTGISPGKFIHREILKLLFADGKSNVLEWYGRVHEWQSKLGSRPRTMFHLNFYRSEWVPVARRLLKATQSMLNRNGAS